MPKTIQEHIDYITPGLKLMKGSKASAKRLEIARRGEEDVQKRGFRAASQGAFSPPVLGQPIPDEVLHTLATNPSSLANCDTTITPACIAGEYLFPITAF